MNPKHVPAMAQEAIEYLITGDGGIYLDCTVGTGEHAARILEATSPYGYLIGMDVDPQAIALSEKRLNAYKNRVSLIHGNFADLHRTLSRQGIVHKFACQRESAAPGLADIWGYPNGIAKRR